MGLEEEANWFGEKSIILALMFQDGAQRLGEFLTSGKEKTFEMLMGPGEN
jgi:hypothetical protein